MNTLSPLETLREQAHQIPPMGLEALPVAELPKLNLVDISMPTFAMPEVSIPKSSTRAVAGLAVAAGVAGAGLIGLLKPEKVVASMGECPKPIELLADSRLSPNPGGATPSLDAGGTDIRVTSIGVSGGYGCTGQQETTGFQIENVSESTSPNVRAYFASFEAKIVPGSVRVNGQPLAEGQCDYPDSEGPSYYASCLLKDNVLNGEQAYLDIGTQREDPGQGNVEVMVVSDLPEYNNEDNIARQDITFYQGLNTTDPNAGIVTSQQTRLTPPKFRFTDRLGNKPRKGVLACEKSQFVVRVPNGMPKAENVRFTYSKGGIKFSTGPRKYIKKVNIGDVSRSKIGLSVVRACARGKKPVSGVLTITADNIKSIRYRTIFNPNTNKWRVLRVVPKKATPTNSATTSPQR